MERTTLDEIPRGSKIRVTTNRGVEVITFHHCDGMYSLLTTDDGNNLHLARFTPLVLGSDNVYEIDDRELSLQGSSEGS